MNSLFDLPPNETVKVPEPSRDWHEVPQALFESWSRARQFAYCAARDDHSARQAHSAKDAEFFRHRASAYRQLMQESLQHGGE